MAIFAELNTTKQQVGGTAPTGWITMNSIRPDDDSVAQADGTWLKGLTQYKEDLDAVYAEKLVLTLTIDTRQITNTSSEYMEITAAAMSAAANIMWQLADGTFHTYTNAEFTALWEKINEYRQSLISNKDALVTALDAAPDPSTIDLDTGWPTTTYTT